MSVERLNDCEKIQPFTSKNYKFGNDFIFYKESLNGIWRIQKRREKIWKCVWTVASKATRYGEVQLMPQLLTGIK